MNHDLFTVCLVILKFRFEATRGVFRIDFGILNRGKMARAISDRCPSPSFRTPSRGRRLSHELRFGVHQVLIHGGSQVESYLEPGTLRPKPRPLPLRHRGPYINSEADSFKKITFH
ncbi:hypothetical protein AVEN_170471-1 [Araneus ventricosus]|uniref:Uncharacterized protein n=1 Tax=Araneus ventricosus TaxID=182803 RepID=A0A4Y2BYP1_ARAVE|nr:hypothetical protein AVEN_170471-1 [Araneus ventricosus]